MPDLTAWSPETWSAAGALATAAIALIAAIVAARQVKEARRLRLEQAQPYVIVGLEASPVWENVILLVVENIGHTAAHNVRVTFDQPLATTIREHGYDINNAAFLKDGIPTLPPGRRIDAIFDYSHDRYGTSLPMRYVATVTCTNHKGKPYDAQDYVVDWSIFYGRMRMTEYGVHAAAKALREMNETLQKWTSRGINVWSRDLNEKDARAREGMRQRRKEHEELLRSLDLKPSGSNDLG